jgi:hypothetical protein
MRNFTLAFATMFATFSFAQFDQGKWTFGAGQMFNTTANFDAAIMGNGPGADVSYFVVDNFMLSISLSGNTEVGDDDDFYYVESQMNFGIGGRYYIANGLFAGLNLTKVEYVEYNSDGVAQYEDSNDYYSYGDPETDTGFDVSLQIGFSKELAFDGKLWFEPMFEIYKPKQDYDTPMLYGLGAMFRFAF